MRRPPAERVPTRKLAEELRAELRRLAYALLFFLACLGIIALLFAIGLFH